MQENITQARLYGDTEIRRAERSQILDNLNRLALEIAQVSFNELCRLDADTDAIRSANTQSPTIYSVVPLGKSLLGQEPPAHLTVPAGYQYLGQFR